MSLAGRHDFTAPRLALLPIAPEWPRRHGSRRRPVHGPGVASFAGVARGWNAAPAFPCRISVAGFSQCGAGRISDLEHHLREWPAPGKMGISHTGGRVCLFAAVGRGRAEYQLDACRRRRIHDFGTSSFATLPLGEFRRSSCSCGSKGLRLGNVGIREADRESQQETQTESYESSTETRPEATGKQEGRASAE